MGSKQLPTGDQLALTHREASESVLSDLLSDPGYLLNTIWPDVVRDDQFNPAAHCGLVLLGELCPGVDEVSIAEAEGFKRGFAFLAHIIRESRIIASDQDLRQDSSGRAA